MSDFDPVQKPKHYNIGRYQPIEVIDDWKLGFSLGNAVKYIARAAHKGTELEDLKKAAWYLNHRIEELGGATEPKKIAERHWYELAKKLMLITKTDSVEDALRDLELAMSFVMKHEERNPSHLLLTEGGEGRVACGATDPTSMTTVGRFDEVTCKDCRVTFLRAGK